MSSSSHEAAARGRDASKVTEIPVAGWKDILWRVVQEFSEDRVMLVAGGVTFYILLAMVPALAAFVSVFGLFADPQAITQQVDALAGVVPDGAMSILQDQLTRLASQGQTTLGLTTLISVAVSLWSANSGMKGLFEVMNVAYDEDEKRSYVKLTLVTMAFTLSTIVAVLLLLGSVVVLPLALGFLGVGDGARWAVRIGSFVAVFAIMTAGLAALYRWGPSREEARWRWITPGATLTILLTLIVSGLFSWYVASFGSYNATYGSLGALIGFMTWIWITVIVLILGAEMNSEAEHQTARDTTTGPEAPMGRRGAVMADRVGKRYGAGAERPRQVEGATAPRRNAERRPAPGRVALLLGLAWLQRRR